MIVGTPGSSSCSREAMPRALTECAGPRRFAPTPAMRVPWSASRKRTKHPGAESVGMGGKRTCEWASALAAHDPNRKWQRADGRLELGQLAYHRHAANRPLAQLVQDSRLASVVKGRMLGKLLPMISPSHLQSSVTATIGLAEAVMQQIADWLKSWASPSTSGFSLKTALISLSFPS